MDPTDTHSQEHEGDFINITQLSNPAGDENVDHPSADEVTSQTDVSPLQVTEKRTDTTQETSSKDDGSETENDVGKEKHLEKDHEGSWSNVEDKKGHEDVLKEIQMPKNHDLYCSNCTHNITGTAKLFKKGQETFPYNIDRFVFVIIFSFKYPFIYIPWLYNITQEPVNRSQTKPPLPEATPVPKPDNTLATLLKKIRETLLPDRLPRLTRTSQRFLLFLVLLLLSVIFLWTLPSQPSPPRTIEEGNPTETIDVPGRDDGGGVSFSWLPNFLSNNYLPIILSLFLAILAVLWRSMIDPKETGAVTHPQKLDAGTDQAKLDAFVWLIEINYTNSPVTKVIPKEKLKNNEGPENDPKETGAVTNPQKLDDGTDQAKDTNPPVTEVIPETKPRINENQKEDPPNKEGDTSKASASSIKVLLIKLLPIKLDILKSIVYGGLIESITSFGVVSSAAASGTSTLNVLALGLANLFSGLFIIIHSLYGLFKRPRYQSWNNDHMPELVSVDPYEELLGKRNKVILHCFVVFISFIFFGVIPPLFYGFSFKITDKGRYQEAAIFVAASLVCVISLSFAKACAFGMDKLKTVAAYTGIAIAGSALSFVASQHARDVFAKYDFHKLASDYLKG
uniref:Membrane protein of ER body-like protein n=1 Tax=Brassica oleracea var. oleracea TaxID=109376 RepID=A0A0D3A743_BRAOL